MKRVCLKQFPGPCMPHPRTNASNGTGRRRRRLAVTDQCFNASIAQLGATPQRRYAYDHVNEASLYVESNYSERAWDYCIVYSELYLCIVYCIYKACIVLAALCTVNCICVLCIVFIKRVSYLLEPRI